MKAGRAGAVQAGWGRAGLTYRLQECRGGGSSRPGSRATSSGSSSWGTHAAPAAAAACRQAQWRRPQPSLACLHVAHALKADGTKGTVLRSHAPLLSAATLAPAKHQRPAGRRAGQGSGHASMPLSHHESKQQGSTWPNLGHTTYECSPDDSTGTSWPSIKRWRPPDSPLQPAAPATQPPPPAPPT